MAIFAGELPCVSAGPARRSACQGKGCAVGLAMRSDGPILSMACASRPRGVLRVMRVPHRKAASARPRGSDEPTTRPLGYPPTCKGARARCGVAALQLREPGDFPTVLQNKIKRPGAAEAPGQIRPERRKEGKGGERRGKEGKMKLLEVSSRSWAALAARRVSSWTSELPSSASQTLLGRARGSLPLAALLSPR